jgi:hypothetical protein
MTEEKDRGNSPQPERETLKTVCRMTDLLWIKLSAFSDQQEQQADG